MSEGETKNKMGRPTKLTQELVDKARRYVEVETKFGGLYAGDLPTVAGLSLYLDVARSTIFEWAKLDTPLGKDFSDSVEKLDATQEYQLIGKSLKGEYNSNIASILLSNHGHIKKTEVDSNIKGDVSFVNAVPRPKKGE